MIRNYFKIAWRNFRKNMMFSFINVFGLAIGFTCCMLIASYLFHELSYDRYHHDVDRLYQVGTTFIREGEENMTGNTPALMAATMQEEFGEIEMSARLLKAFRDDKTLLQTGDGNRLRSFYETEAYFADSTFFNLFSYDFIEGRPSTALVQPFSVVLTEDIAQKLFGNETALNQVIRISSTTNGDHDFRVTGVFRPRRQPTHINARIFMSINGGDMADFIRRQTGLVNNNMFSTYLLLKEGTDAKKLEARFPAFLEKHAGVDLKAAGFGKKQFLTPVTDIHLKSEIPVNVTPTGSVTYLYILGSIAFFILLIACINFMNLSTARSSKRSAEVGVRKVLGAERMSLVRQFLGESLFMALISFILATALYLLLKPLFEEVSGKSLAMETGESVMLWAGFLALAILTGLLAGSYPALYLSSFQPVRVLKSRFSNSFAAVSLRKGLVVMQFVISVVLIISSVVIRDQMRYMRSKDLGFDKSNQIVIPLRSETAKAAYPALRNALAAQATIQSAGGTFYYPGNMHPSDLSLYTEGKTVNEAKKTYMNWVDQNFLETVGMKLLAGRTFKSDADTNNRMVVNEEFVRQLDLGTPQEAIGRRVAFDWQGETYFWNIIGVIRNFHFKDLHQPIEPYSFQLTTGTGFSYLIAHSKPGGLSSTLQAIEREWKKANPNEPFEYSFLDDDFEKVFSAENRLSSIVTYFTIIAIFISCLGLFGLATFSAEQRTKEIGIRKVLGASVSSIVGLLSREFLRLVLIAFILAAPLAWYAMNRWLQDFAYRISIGWWIFLVAAILALLIAFLTISFQALRAATTNPVKNLRTE